MPKTLFAFEHLGESFRKGQEVDLGHPLVALAPHLFALPAAPDPDPTEPVRIRGPLVNPPKSRS